MVSNRIYEVLATMKKILIPIIIVLCREFDTSFSIAKTRHIEITPLAVNFFVKFYDFVSACWCLL